MTEVFRGDHYYEFNDPEVIVAEADLSLHIEPRDLNMLSMEAGRLTAQSPIDLRSQLTRGVDERDRGLLYVSKQWVSYMAAVPISSVSILAERWASRMRESYDTQDIVVTGAMTQALTDLIALCARACAERLPVVHVWWP